MFIEINGVYRNRRLIASVVCYEAESKYFILYKLQNGEQLIEEFSTKSARDDKYHQAVE